MFRSETTGGFLIRYALDGYLCKIFFEIHFQSGGYRYPVGAFDAHTFGKIHHDGRSLTMRPYQLANCESNAHLWTGTPQLLDSRLSPQQYNFNAFIDNCVNECEMNSHCVFAAS